MHSQNHSQWYLYIPSSQHKTSCFKQGPKSLHTWIWINNTVLCVHLQFIIWLSLSKQIMSPWKCACYVDIQEWSVCVMCARDSQLLSLLLLLLLVFFFFFFFFSLAIKGQRQLKDRCLRAKWTSLPFVFLCILKFMKGQQEWSVSCIWPVGYLWYIYLCV